MYGIRTVIEHKDDFRGGEGVTGLLLFNHTTKIRRDG
jgi:hypothetical protein